MIPTEEVATWLEGLQDSLCTRLEEFDGVSPFTTDRWERREGGGGVTRVLAGDGPLEKAAVNRSLVWGESSALGSESRAAGSGEFTAAGISIIVHPRNPHAPTFHANLRYFTTQTRGAWFGGGADLTPHYLYEDDATHFHGLLKTVCDRHEVADYASWKEECDRYFYLPHRREARGIGGIFFDHLSEDLERVWAFVQDLGGQVGTLYLPVLERRSTIPYGPAEETWQLHRRGRYAEFNLIWDRGTRFGLETGGRTESILASLPPRVSWGYHAEAAPGSEEAKLEALLKGEPRAWAR